MYNFFLPFFFFLLSIFPCWAADFQQGVKAYQDGDYEAAFNEWLPLADDGDPMGLYGLGILYHEGKGVSQDYDEALMLFEEAADFGNEFALNKLGVMHDNGQGVLTDYEIAWDYYMQAAEEGVTEAIFNLGVMLDTGKLGEENDQGAIEMYQIAAEQGHEGAINNLANPLNKIKKEQVANPPQSAALDERYKEILQKYENDEDFGDVALYNALLQLANQGHPASQHLVGKILFDGIETEKGSNNYILLYDSAAALEYFNKAADGGHIEAVAWAAYVHYIGEGEYGWKNVTQNLPEAVRLYKKAADLGVNWASSALAQIYMEGGEGVEKNLGEARRLLEGCVATYDYCNTLLAELGEQVVSDSPIMKLKDAMETFILIETCHEMNSVFYVSHSQMDDFRSKMGALQDHYITLGADPDEAWNLANNEPSETTATYLSTMEIFKLSGDYNSDMEKYCNLFKFSFPEVETSGTKTRKKSF